MKVRTQSDALTQPAPRRARAVCLRASDGQLSASRAAASSSTWPGSMASASRASPARRRARSHTRRGRRPQQSVFPRSTTDLCIVCSRCVRACEETQGTFALTIEGRGLESRVSASQDQPFLESECVSCGACVEACPTGALMEKSIIGPDWPRTAAAGGADHLRVLRRGLRADRRSHGRRGRRAWCRTATGARTRAMPA